MLLEDRLGELSNQNLHMAVVVSIGSAVSVQGRASNIRRCRLLLKSYLTTMHNLELPYGPGLPKLHTCLSITGSIFNEHSPFFDSGVGRVTILCLSVFLLIFD